MITPEHIDRKEFSVKLRGYSPQEVDDFLDAVLASYREVLAELANLRRDRPTEVIPPVIGDMTRLLAVAQETADRTVAEANGQAGDIVVSAHKEADGIVNAGHEQRHVYIKELETRKADLEHHVDALQRAMEAARGRLQGALVELGDGPV